jgi:hypothetical protein
MLLKVGSLRQVFNSGQQRTIDAQIARLSVLYEDMRIELTAAGEESILLLDKLNPVEESDGRILDFGWRTLSILESGSQSNGYGACFP